MRLDDVAPGRCKRREGVIICFLMQQPRARRHVRSTRPSERAAHSARRRGYDRTGYPPEEPFSLSGVDHEAAVAVKFRGFRVVVVRSITRLIASAGLRLLLPPKVIRVNKKNSKATRMRNRLEHTRADKTNKSATDKIYSVQLTISPLLTALDKAGGRFASSAEACCYCRKTTCEWDLPLPRAV